MELSPTDPRHQPYFGSALEYVLRRRGSLGPNSVDNVFLPFPFSSQRTDQPLRAGPYAQLPRRGLPSEMDRVRRRGDEGRRQGAARLFVPRQGAVSRLHAGQPFPHVGHGRAAGHDARSVRSPPHAACSNSTAAAAIWNSRWRASRCRRFQQTAFSMLTSPKISSALDVRREARDDARPVRDDAVRPVVPGGPAADRSGDAARLGLLGRIRTGRRRVGHALRPFPADDHAASAAVRSVRIPG